MDLKVIKTRSDYEAALAEVERLAKLNPARRSPDGERLQVLAVLVQKYEEEA